MQTVRVVILIFSLTIVLFIIFQFKYKNETKTSDSINVYKQIQLNLESEQKKTQAEQLRGPNFTIKNFSNTNEYILITEKTISLKNKYPKRINMEPCLRLYKIIVLVAVVNSSYNT